MTSVESLYLWKQWDQLLHIFLLLSYWFLFKLFSRERSRCSENSLCGGSLHLNLDQFSCDHCYCWLLICSVLKQPYPNRNHCSGYIHCGFGQGLCKIKKKNLRAVQSLEEILAHGIVGTVLKTMCVRANRTVQDLHKQELSNQHPWALSTAWPA